MVTFRCVLEMCALEGDYSFTFPHVNNSIVNVEENANISLPFAFSSACGLPDEFRITVAKARSLPPMVCQIIHRNGTCTVHVNYGASCKCLLEEGEGEYLLTKEAEQDDSDTWIWWKDREEDQGTRLVVHIIAKNNGNVTDSNTLEPTGPNFTTETPTDTTGNPEIEPKTFQNENVAIVSAIAGFVVLAIIAIIIVCVKTGRGKTETEVEMTHQETSDSPPHDLYPGHRRTQYCELTWENIQPGQGRNLTTDGMRTRRESATPYAVVHVAPSRSMSNVSEDIYHEVGNTVIVHASQGDQSERPLPPPPDLDPDGYMTPRPATH